MHGSLTDLRKHNNTLVTHLRSVHFKSKFNLQGTLTKQFKFSFVFNSQDLEPTL